MTSRGKMLCALAAKKIKRNETNSETNTNLRKVHLTDYNKSFLQILEENENVAEIIIDVPVSHNCVPINNELNKPIESVIYVNNEADTINFGYENNNLHLSDITFQKNERVAEPIQTIDEGINNAPTQNNELMIRPVKSVNYVNNEADVVNFEYENEVEYLQLSDNSFQKNEHVAEVIITSDEAMNSLVIQNIELIRPIDSVTNEKEIEVLQPSKNNNNLQDCNSEDSDADSLFQPDQPNEDTLSSDEGNKDASRKRKSNPSKWLVNKTIEMRSKCMPYDTKRGKMEKKYPKAIDCSHCRFKCQVHFNEDDRKEICKTYWSLCNYGRQKDFILKHVTGTLPKRRKVHETSENARGVSKNYSLSNNKGTYRVCAKFFEKTLSISNGPINTALSGLGSSGCFVGTDQRGKKEPGNKTSKDQLMVVKQHIESFPSMDPHYVRKSSKRKYLDTKLSILKMYSLYQDYCKEKNFIPISSNTYRRIFCTEYNLSFFQPKKDQCALCNNYLNAKNNQKESLQSAYDAHLSRKESCNKMKQVYKERAKTDINFQTVTFDLQSVLQLPSSEVSQLYYSRKLCVYNLTLYEGGGNNEAYCFCWNELHGKRGGSEIGSVLFRYIQNLPEIITELSFFSDTCGGQNRNQHVAAILLYAVSKTHVDVIEHMFLESGHSFMECDSMHSAIESAKKNVSVFMMNDWKEIFKMARSNRGKNKNKSPYHVEELKYSDFYDLPDLSSKIIRNRNIDEDGNKVRWLNVKCLRYEKKYPGVIFYKYNHSDEFKKILVTGRGRPRNLPQLSQAYTNMMHISAAKKRI